MFLKKYLKYGFILCLSIFIIGNSYTPLHAQKKTQRKIEKEFKKKLKEESKEKHSPHKATIYSMILPGLGQAYNKKYWKIPIVYAGFGAMIYFISANQTEHTKFKEAYDYTELGDDTLPIPNEYVEIYDANQLKNARDIYRRNLDYSYIITGLWYAINIIDATVDAHLFEFEVTDDLSLRVEPDIKFLPQQSKAYTGFRLTVKLPISKH